MLGGQAAGIKMDNQMSNSHSQASLNRQSFGMNGERGSFAGRSGTLFQTGSVPNMDNNDLMPARTHDQMYAKAMDEV